MTISRGHFGGKRAVGPENLIDHRGRYFLETFGQEPFAGKKGAVYVAPGGTSLQEQWIATGRYRFEYSFLGDATDLFVPTLATEGGWNWAAIATNTLDRGLEINFGGTTSGHPRNFLSSEDWFFRVLLGIDNASGADITVGFKKVATPVLTLTEVTDIAGVRIFGDSSSALAALQIVTNLNNGGSTDYTADAISPVLTDGQYMELEVQCVSRKARFYVNGVRYKPAAEYTFDSGDLLAPVIRQLQTTDIHAQFKTYVAEGGPLLSRSRETLLVEAFATA